MLLGAPTLPGLPYPAHDVVNENKHLLNSMASTRTSSRTSSSDSSSSDSSSSSSSSSSSGDSSSSASDTEDHEHARLTRRRSRTKNTFDDVSDDNNTNKQAQRDADTAGEEDEEPKFFCDACGNPIVGLVRFDCLVSGLVPVDSRVGCLPNTCQHHCRQFLDFHQSTIHRQHHHHLPRHSPPGVWRRGILPLRSVLCRRRSSSAQTFDDQVNGAFDEEEHGTWSSIASCFSCHRCRSSRCRYRRRPGDRWFVGRVMC